MFWRYTLYILTMFYTHVLKVYIVYIIYTHVLKVYIVYINLYTHVLKVYIVYINLQHKKKPSKKHYPFYCEKGKKYIAVR